MELASVTGAEILHGGQIPFTYGRAIRPGEVLAIGGLQIKALPTPGHTDESHSYALYDGGSKGRAYAVMTGDALFVGEVGRTDFYGVEERVRLAGNLYDSLHKVLLPLGDGCIVLPAHGAGSACGESIADREISTIGMEKETNRWLQLSRDEFIAEKLEESMERPRYFRKMEVLNLNGPPLLRHLPVPKPMNSKEVMEARNAGAYLLDVRMPYSFGGAFIDGSTNIWLDGLPAYGGWDIPYDTPIILMMETMDQLPRAVRVLVRLGYDEVRGYLRVGMDQHLREGRSVARIDQVPPAEALAMQEEGATMIDVRDHREKHAGMIEGALEIHIGELDETLEDLDLSQQYIPFCSSGYRGSMATSMMKRKGFDNVTNMMGGFNGWKNAGMPIVKE
jgi:hydroxyacylglutathione hydrolase